MAAVSPVLWEALRVSGWLPPGAESSWGGSAPAGDLLPAIRAAWRAATAPRRSGSRAQRADEAARWLDGCLAQGARLTFGVPGVDAGAAERWLAHRLVWWPWGMPSGVRNGLVSSRLGRQLHRRPEWFAALRSACACMDGRREVLLTAPGTAAAPFVERASRLFHLPCLSLAPPRDGESLTQWLGRHRRRAPSPPPENCCAAFLSPPLHPPGAPPESPSTLANTPLRDRSVVAASDQLWVLHARPGGYLAQLVEARLSDPRWAPASVRLALGPGLVPSSLAGSWLALGAVAWSSGMVAPRPPSSLRGAHASGEPPSPAAPGPWPEGAAADWPAVSLPVPGPIISVPTSDNWDFLTHWTRRQWGPWPGESEEEYRDQLILGVADADRSAAAALRRIVLQGVIRATARTIRGGVAVVSFTAVPLAEVSRRRVFRPHRGRWDFEPYGICIRRAWLEQRGARAVRYGEDADWAQLPPGERPFFQRRASGPRRGMPIDWAEEREWRHPGDVHLRELPPSEGLLFVPSHEEAQHLAPVSRWPVVVLDVSR